MAEALLSLHDIRVRYDEPTVLQFASLAVYPGEVLAIIGPNGAGKSTLLRLMGLLQQPTEGKIYFHGDEVTQKNALAIRRRMASVFQEPLLLNASVYDNAALGLKLRGLDWRSTEQRISGGEAQRTSLARALVLDPELLLLDEPFSSLDPPTREGFLIDLETILRDTGITTVFVTHDRNEALMLGDRVGVLMGGRLLQLGPATEILSRPKNQEVADFIGVGTKIAGVVEEATSGRSRIRVEAGNIEVAGNFRPGERVLLAAQAIKRKQE